MKDEHAASTPSPTSTPPPSPQSASAMGRRNFLQVGFLGAAASCAGVRPDPEALPPLLPLAPPAPADGTDPALVVDGAADTWNEPWVWRPSEWPGQQLGLNVVENQNPGAAVGFGNSGAILFSYGGNTPGPTIRMKGDETLFVRLRNLLGEDLGQTAIGPNPDPNELAPGLTQGDIPNTVRPDYCLGEHTNGVHAVHVTNLHTHGLHVRPSRNPDGTHSDNVILRILPQADFRRREQDGPDSACAFLAEDGEIFFLRDDEQAGEGVYEFRLGNVQRKKRAAENERRITQGLAPLPPQKHPAGTFWYHPHAHGATHNQVASGMAGFLIVEGDIDEAVNRVLTKTAVANPTQKTGPYDYRERLLFMQRALNISTDQDARARSLQNGSTPLVNGDSVPAVIHMRPGAVERWRVLNGSVDGRGYKRFMVVKGQYFVEDRLLYELVPTPSKDANGNPVLVGERRGPIKLPQLEALEQRKQNLHQLAIDGVTLIEPAQTPNGYRYTITPLAGQNAGTRNPLWDPDPACMQALRNVPADRQDAVDLLCRLRNVWKNGTHIKNCFVRPNEFYMGPANRTDVFFKAPTTLDLTDPATNKRFAVYTILAKAVLVHSDNPQESFQQKINGETPGTPSAEDIAVAWILVEETPGQTPIAPYDMGALMAEVKAALPPVQDYLLPVTDDELTITPEEVAARDLPPGTKRTRITSYTGWGSQDFPLVSTFPSDPSAEAFAAFVHDDQTNNGGALENLIYAKNGADASGTPYYVLMPAAIRTMAIKLNNPAPHDPSYPDLPRKFDPTDPNRARMLEETAEEWVVYNHSSLLWGNTTTNKKGPNDDPRANTDPRLKSFTQPTTQYKAHYLSYPITRAEGQAIFDTNHDFQVVTRAIDHPFHIHQNPFWVMRIEIPDENGTLTNILDAPRWMDVLWIPRHRGRIVFRTRFPDYVGTYVHHCHILLHEDNGMMHVIQATPFADESNYEAQPPTWSAADSPRPDAAAAYVLNSTFIDPDDTTGQVYPGFTPVAPRLP